MCSDEKTPEIGKCADLNTVPFRVLLVEELSPELINEIRMHFASYDGHVVVCDLNDVKMVDSAPHGPLVAGVSDFIRHSNEKRQVKNPFVDIHAERWRKGKRR